MANRLLDRQVSLLEYLTSGAAIFGGKDDASLDQALRGIDSALLRLEAGFSHEKRMAKIVPIFCRTFEILGDSRAAIIEEFAESCPQVDISRLVNASQFHDFISTRPPRAPEPPYLRDVAACELAWMKVRGVAQEQRTGARNGRKRRPRGAIRRSSGVALVRCVYDIRPIFEEGLGAATPVKRDTPLAVAMPPGAADPRVFEVLPVVFDLLTALDDWTAPTEFDAIPEINQIIAELLEHGLLEVRG